MSRPRRKGWRTVQADPATVGPLLRQAGVVCADSDPVSVRASRDSEGRWRRITARYEGGWRVVLDIGLKGSCSLVQSLSIATEPYRPGAAS